MYVQIRCSLNDLKLTFKLFNQKVLQAIVMISSVVIVALFGVSDVGGLNEVWNRAVNGSRIFPPE